ncbi:MAG TPA: glycosyltransferase [Candidatus Acidoferrales bacterium]|nr:glycosyltransferase [Candidatus Acidoferrales bacterium]
MKTEKRKVLALIGRRDLLSDGVWDYCLRLVDALHPHDIDIQLFETNWAQNGWFAALRTLWSESTKMRADWTLLQYTAMAWSRRGFPIGALVVAWMAKSRGEQLGVVFHESRGFRANGIWARFRFACQEWTIRRLYSIADLGAFTVPLVDVPWLAKSDSKARFIPIGSNIPENTAPRHRTASTESPKTVAVFCVTNRDRTVWEVEEIAAAIRHAVRIVPNLRLTVFGRGAIESRQLLESALAGSGVELSVLGVLSGEEVKRILCDADALLYVRDVLNPRRGCSLAAVACGLPIVSYGDATASYPLSEAGIMLARPGDREGLAHALERVLTDDSMWNSLHLLSLSAYKKFFAWEEIARRFGVVLNAPYSPKPDRGGKVSSYLGSPTGSEDLHSREAPDVR